MGRDCDCSRPVRGAYYRRPDLPAIYMGAVLCKRGIAVANRDRARNRGRRSEERGSRQGRESTHSLEGVFTVPGFDDDDDGSDDEELTESEKAARSQHYRMLRRLNPDYDKKPPTKVTATSGYRWKKKWREQRERSKQKRKLKHQQRLETRRQKEEEKRRKSQQAPSEASGSGSDSPSGVSRVSVAAAASDSRPDETAPVSLRDRHGVSESDTGGNMPGSVARRSPAQAVQPKSGARSASPRASRDVGRSSKDSVSIPRPSHSWSGQGRKGAPQRHLAAVNKATTAGDSDTDDDNDDEEEDGEEGGDEDESDEESSSEIDD